ncbi:hypothetical protein PV327_011408 [Microctonus hyperodae]|uniref:ADAMTS cysteine-rich domain-containing protein n=1 Tax=Microctonus hyperodae TaxID=165561 RepID=A0AA39C384_MICHY|nr:hypothetical protein PV327_011408 [Microctonus hyperodae]
MIKSIGVVSQDCNARMVCSKPDKSGVLKHIRSLPYPLDGTGCGENKVCFGRQCIETSVENND